MQVGDLVKYKKCGTHGIITRTWEVAMPKCFKPLLMLEVLWVDGKISDTRCGRVEAVCK